MRREKKQLAEILQSIKENDENYEVRYGLIIKAMYFANACEYKVAFRVDEQWMANSCYSFT